jgi:HEAT repeat
MGHPNEEELVLYHYHEARDPEGIRRHLDTCAGCRSAYDEICMSLAALDQLTVPERPAHYEARVWHRLRRRLETGSRPRVHAFQWPSLRWAQAGWVLALLLAGFLLGRYLPGPEREELRGMRELLTLSLLQNQSASERLAGVGWSRDFNRPDSRVLGALVETLNHDPDVNVRLAAVDALAKYAQEASVKQQLPQALVRQNSPLVQIALIDLLVELRDRQSADVLRRLAEDDKANEYVRQRAAWGLRQVS